MVLLAARLYSLAFLALFVLNAAAADVPPKPLRYFNDYASLVDSQTAEKLNRQLEDFERETSNQILVVVYPSLPPDSAIEDFTQDAFRAWKPGQQGRNNGAILFVFVKDRKMRIQTGYGLEGALPDAICKRIISDELAPRFQAGDFAGGLTAAVNAMIAAIARGVQRRRPNRRRNRAQTRHSRENIVDLIIFLVVLGIIGLSWLRRAAHGERFTQAPDPANPEVSGGSEEEEVTGVAEAAFPVAAVAVDFREAEVTVAVAVRVAAGDLIPHETAPISASRRSRENRRGDCRRGKADKR